MSEIMTANEEIRRVPPSWKVRRTIRSGRVHYTHPQLAPAGTYAHPTLGDLPEGWQMHKTATGYFYYSTATGKSTTRRPEVHGESRSNRSSPLQQSLSDSVMTAPLAVDAFISPLIPYVRVAALAPLKPLVVPTCPSPPTRIPPGFVQVRPGMTLERNAIADIPLVHKYSVVKIMDVGDGTKGSMNAGVFVVRKKSTKELFIQKNFRANDDFLIGLIRKEISILRMLKCNSLVQYVDGFLQESPFRAAVYMEFCDCGDLGGLLTVFKTRKKSHLNSPTDHIPESFIWHAFLALIDGLHFLATGSSYLALDLCQNDAATWKPVVHRDIKPDNIMLKSRSTPGSTKPLYVVLSDFGMAEYEDESINSGPPWPVFGTPEYHAPELCFDPYPGTQHELNELAGPHTLKSDIWAIAAIIHALCERDALAHMDRSCWMPPFPELRWRGRVARKQVLQIQNRTFYSDRLESCIKSAGHADPAKRPDAQALIPRLKTHMDRWRADPNWSAQSSIECKLPDWAVTKSDLV
ncbi:putative Protein kinase domain-containing protein [Seiridium cardinale]|uniref:non-specific serine/threonine protein kinase n=1 Tax=Seiridium cardinale TaxID=138064 RepID=A0ABR2Y7A5_9PEZI